MIVVVVTTSNNNPLFMESRSSLHLKRLIINSSRFSLDGKNQKGVLAIYDTGPGRMVSTSALALITWCQRHHQLRFSEMCASQSSSDSAFYITQYQCIIIYIILFNRHCSYDDPYIYLKVGFALSPLASS